MSKIKAILFDFSKTLLHPKDSSYTGSLNALHKELSGEDFFAPYPFLDYFFLNNELLDFVAEEKKNGLKIYMFTTERIQERPEIKDTLKRIFDHIFTARDLVAKGIQAESLKKVKEVPEAFQIIASDIQLSPSEILFIDDSPANIHAAQKAGYHTVQFPSDTPLSLANATVIDFIKLLL